jgi:DNA-binding NtrC family response regulator
MHRRRPAVVVVDDDHDSRSDLAQCLTQAGFRCVTTSTVRAALWYIRTLSPIAAVIAPGSGRERRQLAEWLVGHTSDITVVRSATRDQHTASHILAAVRGAASGHGEAAACS